MNRLQEYYKQSQCDSTNYLTDIEIIDSSPDVVDPNKVLFDYIFAFDPVSGMPQGDISVFTGDNANPEIKAFIQANLLQPLVTEKGGMSLPNNVLNQFKGKITDDDVAAFSRNHGEDNEQYAQRMRKYFDDVRAKNDYDRRVRQLKKLIDESVEE